MGAAILIVYILITTPQPASGRQGVPRHSEENKQSLRSSSRLVTQQTTAADNLLLSVSIEFSRRGGDRLLIHVTKFKGPSVQIQAYTFFGFFLPPPLSYTKPIPSVSLHLSHFLYIHNVYVYPLSLKMFLLKDIGLHI